jgi:hypothetical protein
MFVWVYAREMKMCFGSDVAYSGPEVAASLDEGKKWNEL